MIFILHEFLFFVFFSFLVYAITFYTLKCSSVTYEIIIIMIDLNVETIYELNYLKIAAL